MIKEEIQGKIFERHFADGFSGKEIEKAIQYGKEMARKEIIEIMNDYSDMSIGWYDRFVDLRKRIQPTISGGKENDK